MHRQDFTRKRVLSLLRVVVLIVRGHSLSMQNVVNTLFYQLQQTHIVVTASAYCQARQKLKAEIFSYLNDLIVEEFYRVDADDQQADTQMRRWMGHRLVAVDGSMLNLPNSSELRAHFDASTSVPPHVTALAIVSYDVLNHLALGARLQAQTSITKSFIEQQAHLLEAEDLLLADREFGDYGLLAWLVTHERLFVIRLQRKSFQAAQAFANSAESDAIVTITMPERQRAFCKQHGLPKTLRLRLVKVQLDTGETELLVSSLLDGDRYASTVFKELYGKRWGVETYFDHLKNILEVERFSGTSLLSVEQDFYGLVFLTTLEAVISDAPDRELQQQSQQRDCQHTQRVNRSLSYSVLLKAIIALLVDPGKSTQEVLDEMHHLMKKNPSLERPDRRYERKRTPPRAQVRFHKYRKRRPS